MTSLVRGIATGLAVPVPSRIIGAEIGSLLQDTFSDVNGVLLPAHVMDTGAGWRADTGSFQIQAGQAVQNGNANGNLVSADSGASNAAGSVSILHGAGATPRPGIAFRVQDANNYWITELYQAGSAFIVSEVVGGVVTQRGSYTVTIVNGNAYAVQVVLQGSAITIYLGGVQVITYTGGSGVGRTRWGLYNYNDTVSTFDNFTVTQ